MYVLPQPVAPVIKRFRCSDIYSQVASLFIRSLFSKLQKSHATPISLLFHTPGGQYCIDHSVRVYTNPFSPFAEAVAIPLQIFLVIFWHMFCNEDADKILDQKEASHYVHS